MALVRSSTTVSTDAQSCMRSAISEFEHLLSAQEHVSFKDMVAHSQASRPTLQDVWKFATTIDEKTVKVSDGTHCFGTRTSKLLTAIQQYISLADVVIGGAQNLLASSVWALVRLSVLIWVNYSKYLEKFSVLLAEVGRTAPRYDELAECFAKSPRLQEYLVQYYTVVVRLCTRLVAFTRRSAFKRFTSSIPDPQMLSWQAELSQWALEIQNEVQAEMAKAITAQSRCLSKIHAALTLINKQNATLEMIKTKREVLDLCCQHDHLRRNESFWKEILEAGQATVHRTMPHYADWLSSTIPKNIIFSGIVGAGKTVLLANVVRDLLREQNSDTTSVAYFFCRVDDIYSLKARVIIGSLLRQILQGVPDVAKLQHVVPSMHEKLDAADILRRMIYSGKLRKDLKVFWVIDGIHECDSDEIEKVYQQIREIRQILTLIVCISTRQPPHDRIHTRWGLDETRFIEMPVRNPDLDLYIEREVQRRKNTGDLKVGNPDLLATIGSTLIEGSQGMFLWAVLQIRSLCMMHTDRDIRFALKNMPKTLSELYRRLLEQATDGPEELRVRLLQFIDAAAQPLTIAALGEALSVKAGDTKYDPEQSINDVHPIIEYCKCVLAINQEDRTVRFVHPSVKIYLEASPRLDRLQFTSDSAQKMMLETIATFLNYDIFNTQLAARNATTLKLRAATVSQTILDASLKHNAIARVVLQRWKPVSQQSHDVTTAVPHCSPQSNAIGLTSKSEFLKYARRYAPYHALKNDVRSTFTYQMLPRLYGSTQIDWNFGGDHGTTALMRAAEAGDCRILKMLLANPHVNVDQEDDRGRTACLIAAEHGRDSIIELLKGHESISLNAIDALGSNAIYLAASSGHLSTVRLLVDTMGRTQVDVGNSWQQRPLSTAANIGHATVVEELLTYAEVDVNARDKWGRSALSHAASNGHVLVLHALLKSGRIDINQVDDSGKTALVAAAEAGHRSAVIELLAYPAIDVEKQDKNGHNALWYAVRGGFTDTGTLLANHNTST